MGQENGLSGSYRRWRGGELWGVLGTVPARHRTSHKEGKNLKAERFMDVLTPILEPSKVGDRLAARLPTLDGKTIGILWNNRTHGDRLLAQIEETLKDQHEVKGVIKRKKDYFGEPMSADLLDELVSSCDAVITGVGD